RELAAWQRALDVQPPIFAGVNVFSRQLLRHDLLADVKAALTRNDVQRGTLKLEMTEGLVMDNPEFAALLLQRLREIGVGARPAILRSIVTMAHDLGMDVVAEGAESESDAVELSQLGCECAQ